MSRLNAMHSAPYPVTQYQFKLMMQKLIISMIFSAPGIDRGARPESGKTGVSSCWNPTFRSRYVGKYAMWIRTQVINSDCYSLLGTKLSDVPNVHSMHTKYKGFG
jgi:hypothetical protein